MTNKEYLKQELPLWLFNRLVPNSLTDDEFKTINTGRNAFDYADTKEAIKTPSMIFGRWKDQEETMADIFKRLWSQSKDFVFPCTVEEALSILEIVEPEFYQFIVKRRSEASHPSLSRECVKWFGEPGSRSFITLSLTWDNTVENDSYWRHKTDFSLSPQYIAERTVVTKKPKTIGEWLDLSENALIKEIFEFDYRLNASRGADESARNGKTSEVDMYHWIPSHASGVYTQCRNRKSFQPYIDWYNNHPQNPKNVTPAVALKNVREIHTIEWWRDELAKTEPEVAAYLYKEYVKQNRLLQTPSQLFPGNGNTLIGGLNWGSTEFGDVMYEKCKHTLQPLKEALAAKKPAVIVGSVGSVNSQMKGATFPCTIQERIDWMLTQPSLKPIARFIIGDGTYKGNREVHGEFTNDLGDSFAYWATSKNVIEQDCNRARSWEPFFQMYPHLRVKTPKPVELKKINEHRQLLVECANIKEVKLLLKHVNQEDAFTHSKRLVVFYDLDEKKIYHVGSTKKSQWKQIPNKVHMKVSVEQFLSEVPQVNLAADRKPRLGASERKVTVTEIHNISVKTSSWFDDVPVETKKPTKINWFD